MLKQIFLLSSSGKAKAFNYDDYDTIYNNIKELLLEYDKEISKKQSLFICHQF